MDIFYIIPISWKTLFMQLNARQILLYTSLPVLYMWPISLSIIKKGRWPACHWTLNKSVFTRKIYGVKDISAVYIKILMLGADSSEKYGTGLQITGGGNGGLNLGCVFLFSLYFYSLLLPTQNNQRRLSRDPNFYSFILPRKWIPFAASVIYHLPICARALHTLSRDWDQV